MARILSAIRTLPLSLVTIAGHTVRIAHSLVGLAGAAMVSWGVSMIYSPAGWITGGAFLCWTAFELSNVAARRRPIVRGQDD